MTVDNRRSFLVRTFILSAALFASPAAALGDAGHAHGTASVGEPGKTSAATRTVEVTLADNYYEPESVRVTAGETVRFVLTNTGELLHEFSIGTATMHADHQEHMAMMMEHGMLTPTGIDHEMMKMDHSKMGVDMPMKHSDPNSVLVEPGETKELVWTFIRPAEIEFACNIPGHYQAGMVGTIEFQR